MSSKQWVVGQLSYADRMPPLPAGSMNESQRKVAEELTNGPRGGVKGPFIPALRSPDLVDRLGKLGEYLRFGKLAQAGNQRTRDADRLAGVDEPVRVGSARAS